LRKTLSLRERAREGAMAKNEENKKMKRERTIFYFLFFFKANVKLNLIGLDK
jgi:hypothetical protein